MRSMLLVCVAIAGSAGCQDGIDEATTTQALDVCGVPEPKYVPYTGQALPGSYEQHTWVVVKSPKVQGEHLAYQVDTYKGTFGAAYKVPDAYVGKLADAISLTAAGYVRPGTLPPPPPDVSKFALSLALRVVDAQYKAISDVEACPPQYK